MLGGKVPESYLNLPRATPKRRGRPINCIDGLCIKAFWQDPKLLIKGGNVTLKNYKMNRSSQGEAPQLDGRKFKGMVSLAQDSLG